MSTLPTETTADSPLRIIKGFRVCTVFMPVLLNGVLFENPFAHPQSLSDASGMVGLLAEDLGLEQVDQDLLFVNAALSPQFVANVDQSDVGPTLSDCLLAWDRTCREGAHQPIEHVLNLVPFSAARTGLVFLPIQMQREAGDPTPFLLPSTDAWNEHPGVRSLNLTITSAVAGPLHDLVAGPKVTCLAPQPARQALCSGLRGLLASRPESGRALPRFMPTGSGRLEVVIGHGGDAIAFEVDADLFSAAELETLVA